MRTTRKHMPKTARYYLVPAALFFAIIAANVYVYRQDPHQKDASVPLAGAEAEQIQASALPADVISVKDVQNLTEKEAPGSEISKVELRTKDDKAIFVVELQDKTVLAFDAKTGLKLAESTTNEAVEKLLPSEGATTVEIDPAPADPYQKPVESNTDAQPQQDTTTPEESSLDGAVMPLVSEQPLESSL